MPISIEPMAQTSFPGTFALDSDGFVVGTAMQDPVARFHLEQGVLDASETLPMFGGIAITTLVPGLSPRSELGKRVKRATQIPGATPAAGDLRGWCMFDQAHAMVASPASPVPQASAGMSLNFYELGSAARIVLPISASLAGSLRNGNTNARLSWDFANQQLCPVAGAGSAVNIGAAAWANGVATITVATDMTSRLAVGAPAVIASANPTAWNGTWVVQTINATTITLAMPSNPGSYVGSGTIDEVTSAQTALPGVTIMDVNVGNSLVPVYSAATGLVTWNRTGSAAVVRI